MGFFERHVRFREAGQAANSYNVETFGEPVRSLFTRSKVFSLHHRIEVTDEQENVLYRSWTKFWTLHDRTQITDAQDRPVASFFKKFWTLHERRFVTMADGTQFQLSNELFHIIADITNIEGLGWQLRGNIAALNFELYDTDGSVIAVISQKMISLHDKYCIDLYKPECEAAAVTILIALQHMIKDRESSSSGSSFSSSSSSSN